jgi:sugar diacid utilization regulator
MEGSREPLAVMAAFVAGLSPDSAVAAVTTPDERAVAGAGLSPGAIGWAVELGRRCSDATRISQGEHAAELTEEDTRHAIEVSMLGLLRRLSGAESIAPLNEWQLTMARTMARLDWPYERYIIGLRMAQDMALEALLDRAIGYRPADARPVLLRAVTREVARYFDDSVRAVIAEFLAERQRAIAQSAAERRRVVVALIAGEPVPADLAAATLGIDLAQHHLALVLWRPAGRDPLGWSKNQLELAVNRAAGRLRTPGTLTMPGDEALGVRTDALLCWLTSPVPFTAGYLQVLAGLFDANKEAAVAVGVPAAAAAGFRRSHLAARDAYQVAGAGATGGSAGGAENRVTGYADVGAVALLSADAERARWFIAEELGRLAEPGAALDDLRETARCYLDSGRNLMDTARRLHVHRNTVVYRLAKIERLLGRPLDERPFATQAALTLAPRWMTRSAD